MASISDLLFEMAEWLRTTRIVDFALWLDTTEPRNWMQENFFIIPLMQTAHIITLAITFFSVLMIYSRAVGVAGMTRTMPETMQRYSSTIWWGLAILVITGIGMIVGEPPRELINPIFWIKMGLVITLVLLSALYYRSIRSKMNNWDNASGRTAIRVFGFCLILLWCAVMAGGRLIAYAPV